MKIVPREIDWFLQIGIYCFDLNSPYGERQGGMDAGACETRAPLQSTQIQHNGNGDPQSCAVEQLEQGF